MDAALKDIEIKKLAVERTKALAAAWAVIVSVISAGLTVGYSIWGAKEAAQYQLVTKFAEITFTPDSPNVSAGKAGALGYLFGKDLPPDLREKLKDPEALRKQLAKSGLADGPPSVPLERQTELLRLMLAADPKDEKRIAETWIRMFPDDAEWVNKFLARRT